MLAGLTILAVPSWMTRKYVAQAQIAVLSQAQGDPWETSGQTSGQTPGERKTFASQRKDTAAIAIHVRALQSPDLAREVVDELGLAARPEFNGALPRGGVAGLLQAAGLAGPLLGESGEDGLLAAFRDALAVYPLKSAQEGTQAIAITFSSADPQLAADVANRLAERYCHALAIWRAGDANITNARATPSVGAGHAIVSDGRDGVQLLVADGSASSARSRFDLAELGEGERARIAPAVAGEVKILARASPPSETAWPKVGLLLLLAIVGAVVAGVIVIVARERVGGLRRASSHHGGAQLVDRAPAMVQPTLAFAGQRAADPSPGRLRSMSIVARQLVRRAKARGGFRTLVIGETSTFAAQTGALELARQLSRLDGQVLLIDWSVVDQGSSDELQSAAPLGLADVLCGRATFENVIERIEQSDVHRMVAGSRAIDRLAATDKNRIDMVLDALDEAYDHIVIVGSEHGLRDLVARIEGRIDAAVCVADGTHPMSPEHILDWHVPDLAIIYCHAPVIPMPAEQGYKHAAVS
jgi:hypothetical protein